MPMTRRGGEEPPTAEPIFVSLRNARRAAYRRQVPRAVYIQVLSTLCCAPTTFLSPSLSLTHTHLENAGGLGHEGGDQVV